MAGKAITVISVKEQLPEENENIIIMCKHGAIFNGTYCNGVWFCMDGYINDVYKDSPIYSSMSSIPPFFFVLTHCAKIARPFWHAKFLHLLH